MKTFCLAETWSSIKKIKTSRFPTQRFINFLRNSTHFLSLKTVTKLHAEKFCSFRIAIY